MKGEGGEEGGEEEVEVLACLGESRKVFWGAEVFCYVQEEFVGKGLEGHFVFSESE